MNRTAFLPSAWGITLGVLVVSMARPGFGQVPPAPPEPAPVGAAAKPPAVGVGDLMRKMADEARRLADDITTDLARSPDAPALTRDAQELAQGLDEFRSTLGTPLDPSGGRQGYAGLHTSWRYLRAQFARPGNSSPVVNRDAERIDAIDDQIAQAVGLNPLPGDYYTAASAPTGIAQTRRLARALVDRADALARAIRSSMGNDPAAGPLIADADALAREADAWHDALRVNTALPTAARSFGPVDAVADRVEKIVTTRSVPPPVSGAWQSFASAEVLVHRNLGLDSAQPAVAIPAPGVNVTVPGVNVTVATAPAPAVAAPAVASPTVTALADQLVEQANAFVQVFGPTAGVVPQGAFMLADAQALLAAATNFRQDAARGLDANALAYEFRDVDAVWVRLARRVNRIARGRTGPNIQQVGKIGDTCEQIHRALGMPGYAPVVGPF